MKKTNINNMVFILNVKYSMEIVTKHDKEIDILFNGTPYRINIPANYSWKNISIECGNVFEVVIERYGKHKEYAKIVYFKSLPNKQKKEVKMEKLYDYKIPILYENKEEEQEATKLRVKDVMTTSSKYPKLGKIDGCTIASVETKYNELIGNGYISWKQLRKKYAKDLKSNPFEVGDKVTSLTEGGIYRSIGAELTVVRIDGHDVYYKESCAASFNKLTLTDLPQREYRAQDIPKELELPEGCSISNASYRDIKSWFVSYYGNGEEQYLTIADNLATFDSNKVDEFRFNTKQEAIQNVIRYISNLEEACNIHGDYIEYPDDEGLVAYYPLSNGTNVPNQINEGNEMKKETIEKVAVAVCVAMETEAVEVEVPKTQLELKPKQLVGIYNTEGRHHSTIRMTKKETKEFLQKPENIGYTVVTYKLDKTFTTAIPVVEVK